jgi:hypothetical protein
MAHTIRFHWPQLGVEVLADLLDDLNPQLTGDLRRALPLASIQAHAMVAGQQIYFPTRLALADAERSHTEPMNEQPPGRINFEPNFQYIALNYGPMNEPVPAWPIGQVREQDLPKLPGLGQEIYRRFLAAQIDLLVIVERADAPPTPLDTPSLTAPYHAEPIPDGLDATALIERMQAETDAIWIREPADVRALRLGDLTFGSAANGASHETAGVYGQYFSPWVMASGLVRSLAIVDLFALSRLTRDPSFSLNQLKTLLHAMLEPLLGVIAFFGLPQLGAMIRAVDRTVDRVDDPAEFDRLIAAFFTYVNRYNLWLYQSFPWRLGAHFPKQEASLSRATGEQSGDR